MAPSKDQNTSNLQQCFMCCYQIQSAHPPSVGKLQWPKNGLRAWRMGILTANLFNQRRRSTNCCKPCSAGNCKNAKLPPKPVHLSTTASARIPDAGRTAGLIVFEPGCEGISQVLDSSVRVY
ncbi:hypothetical protein J6590_034080 [Homalodisca vitripennis]|nr:hypothetical protein J6590_034080 [Homalodisca vitripennis]